MNQQTVLLRYSLAFLTVLSAGALRLGLEPLLALDAPFLLFFLAILLTARYGGSGPGYLATAFSVVVLGSLGLEPRFSLHMGSLADFVNLGLFAAGGTVASIVCGQLREAFAESVREEARFRLISNSVPQFLWTAGPDGVYDFMNSRWFEYTGMEPAQPIGLTWRPLIHPDDLEGVSDDWDQLLACRGSRIRDFRLRRSDGEYHWFETRTAAARDLGGRVVKWFGSTVDIQATRELRDKSRMEAERFEQIARSAPGLICQFLLRPDGTSAMPFASPAIRDIFGLEPEDVKEDASRLFELVHPDDVEALHLSIAESAQSIAIWQREFRVNHPVKGLIWVLGRSSPVREPSGAVSWFGILSDVSAGRKAEQEIHALNTGLERHVKERTAQLEEVNQELESFCYTVSHDLRAPLRHIAGFANILAEEHGPEMSALARSRLKNLQSGAQNMGTLIDDLLRFATLGRQSIASRTVLLNLPVDAALERLTPQCHERKIDWRIQNLGCAECDGGMMRLLFGELLGNAIKYSRNRELAVIEVARMELGGETVISVRDNGAGFEMEYAGKLFGVFQRLHKTADFEGTGIGLATVKRIIHKHGGRVWAQGEVDRGATFFFTFPGIRSVLDSDLPAPLLPGFDYAIAGGSGSVSATEDEGQTKPEAYRVPGRE